MKSNKPKSKKTIVLSKAKKLTDLRRPKTKESGFEVQTEDGTVVQDQIVEDNLIKEDTEQPLRKKVLLTTLFRQHLILLLLEKGATEF